jgi:hypothetical protein
MFDQSFVDFYNKNKHLSEEEFDKLYPIQPMQPAMPPGISVMPPPENFQPYTGQDLNRNIEQFSPPPPPVDITDPTRPAYEANMGGGGLLDKYAMGLGGGSQGGGGGSGLLSGLFGDGSSQPGGGKDWGSMLMALGGGIAGGATQGWGAGLGAGFQGAAAANQINKMLQQQEEQNRQEQAYREKLLTARDTEAKQPKLVDDPRGTGGKVWMNPDNTFSPVDTASLGDAGPAVPDFKNAKALREEYQSAPEYKTYKAAIPIYKSMVETAPRKTRASDLNLVYGLAKIYDPNSVVREGEMVLVKDTSSLPDALIGEINRLNGGAALSPETRQNVLAEARSRMDAYKSEVQPLQEQFFGIAEQYKIPRSYVGNELEELPEVPQLVAPATAVAPSGVTTNNAGVLGGGSAPKRRRWDPATNSFIEVPMGQ